MFDLIRSNLFLMKKSRSTYIMMLIAIATTAITILSNALLIALLHEPADDNSGDSGVSVTMTAEYDEDEEEGTITIYGDPKSYAAIQKHLEECGFEDVGGDFTYIPNDLKEVTPEQRETLDKMVERLEEFDDVQTVYTNMQPEGEE